MLSTLMLKERLHQAVTASTMMPHGRLTVTDTKPQNISHSLKACQLQQIRAVKFKH